MNARALHDGLQASLEGLLRGEDLESLLARQRNLGADLRPALEAAVRLRQGAAEGSLASAMVRSRARVRAALPSHHPTPFLPRSRIIPRFAGTLAAALIAVAAGLIGLAAASAQALPDSPLYIFKRAGEEIQLRLTLSSRARLALQESQTGLRAEEVRDLLLLGRMARVSFQGVVQAQDETVWYVASIPVNVPPGTYQTPGIVRGMSVEVHGETTTNHRFLAEAIHLAGFQFHAAVRSMPDAPALWTIGPRTVLVTQDTVIDPGVRLGDVVLVSVHVHDVGVLIGREILRLQVSAGEAPPSSAEVASPARTQIPDGEESEGNGRGRGSGEGEETEEPEEEESRQGGSSGDSEEEEEEVVVEKEEEETKESHNQSKKGHPGGPNNGP